MTTPPTVYYSMLTRGSNQAFADTEKYTKAPDLESIFGNNQNQQNPINSWNSNFSGMSQNDFMSQCIDFIMPLLDSMGMGDQFREWLGSNGYGNYSNNSNYDCGQEGCTAQHSYVDGEHNHTEEGECTVDHSGKNDEAYNKGFHDTINSYNKGSADAMKLIQGDTPVHKAEAGRMEDLHDPNCPIHGAEKAAEDHNKENCSIHGTKNKGEADTKDSILGSIVNWFKGGIQKGVDALAKAFEKNETDATLRGKNTEVKTYFC